MQPNAEKGEYHLFHSSPKFERIHRGENLHVQVHATIASSERHTQHKSNTPSSICLNPYNRMMHKEVLRERSTCQTGRPSCLSGRLRRSWSVGSRHVAALPKKIEPAPKAQMAQSAIEQEIIDQPKEI